ncbi:hypothetical protein [Erythrobacter sp. F6033]|uniref:hypothetical protein n=1 Tax=Erythrobacter sp. F6033 TaxID=2926401 RepID=UPI001FF62633|nr:hypothetical protein [Erythrobacter sp. F6033]MCK0129817.1 hypothetical protein [Erythrobacter sp. F6033]
MLATKSSPDVAFQLFSANAAAYENAAFASFSEQAALNPNDLSGAARSARSLAVEALRRDPTSAKALALLALSEPETERHKAAIAASQLNRRDLTLQGLTLEARLANEETSQVIETLDQILRVHPEYSREFFPVLGQALENPAAIPAFVRYLDGSSPWHEYFFTNYAVGQASLRPNLATIRLEQPIGDANFDRRLVSQLAKDGEFATAQALFDHLNSAKGDEKSGTGQVGWSSDFPPFDWNFTDESGFRAQASLDGELLEIFARPGNGGAIAERIFAMPQTPFELRLEQNETNANQAENVRIELSCPGQSEPFLTERLALGRNQIAVAEAPGCDQMRLVINARAFSGEATLRARLSQIAIVAR